MISLPWVEAAIVSAAVTPHRYRSCIMTVATITVPNASSAADNAIQTPSVGDSKRGERVFRPTWSSATYPEYAALGATIEAGYWHTVRKDGTASKEWFGIRVTLPDGKTGGITNDAAEWMWLAVIRPALGL